MGSLLLPLGPDVHTTLCVPSKSGASVSPCPVEVLQSNLPSLRTDSLGIPPPIAGPPVGKPDVGLRTFSPVSGLLWYKCSRL